MEIKQASIEDLEQIREIFFESSTKKEFKSQEAKEKFFYKYSGLYFNEFNDFFLVAKEKDKVLGYVCGCPRTQGNVLMLQNHLMSFLDELQRFPAHLHINCHRDSRGMGIGRMLVEAFCKKLDSKGVHIITTKDSENTKFYQALGFDYNKQEGSFYFMGKTL